MIKFAYTCESENAHEPFFSAGYSSDGPFLRMNKRQLHTTTSTIKLSLYYIHYNYTVQLYKRQVFLSAHYLLY